MSSSSRPVEDSKENESIILDNKIENYEKLGVVELYHDLRGWHRELQEKLAAERPDIMFNIVAYYNPPYQHSTESDFYKDIRYSYEKYEENRAKLDKLHDFFLTLDKKNKLSLVLAPDEENKIRQSSIDELNKSIIELQTYLVNNSNLLNSYSLFAMKCGTSHGLLEAWFDERSKPGAVYMEENRKSHMNLETYRILTNKPPGGKSIFEEVFEFMTEYFPKRNQLDTLQKEAFSQTLNHRDMALHRHKQNKPARATQQLEDAKLSASLDKIKDIVSQYEAKLKNARSIDTSRTVLSDKLALIARWDKILSDPELSFSPRLKLKLFLADFDLHHAELLKRRFEAATNESSYIYKAYSFMRLQVEPERSGGVIVLDNIFKVLKEAGVKDSNPYEQPEKVRSIKNCFK